MYVYIYIIETIQVWPKVLIMVTQVAWKTPFAKKKKKKKARRKMTDPYKWLRFYKMLLEIGLTLYGQWRHKVGSGWPTGVICIP